GRQLQMLHRTISPERLWRGSFVRPVAGTEAPTGFGARRIINGKPRAPHGGADYSVALGTPVVAANAGRVALVGEYFFPGRLVAVDHGLGLHTLYFHLDTVAVSEGERVDRGQTLGTVGATGRATGPHLHFGAQLGGARIDPAALLGLRRTDERRGASRAPFFSTRARERPRALPRALPCARPRVLDAFLRFPPPGFLRVGVFGAGCSPPAMPMSDPELIGSLP